MCTGIKKSRNIRNLQFLEYFLQQFLVVCIVFNNYYRTVLRHNQTLPHLITIQCQTASSIDEIFTHLFYKTVVAGISKPAGSDGLYFVSTVLEFQRNWMITGWISIRPFLWNGHKKRLVLQALEVFINVLFLLVFFTFVFGSCGVLPVQGVHTIDCIFLLFCC